MQEHNALDFEQVIEYLEQPEAVAHAGYRRRLLSSPLSRARTDFIQRLQQTLREDPQSIVQSATEESALPPDVQAELQLLSAGTLDDARAAGLRAKVQADPGQLREALHVCAAQTQSGEQTPAPAMGWTERLRELVRWQVPMWAAAGATAVLVLAVLLLVAPGGDPGDGVRVAQYRDDSVIRFSAEDSLPGLGFFADAQTESRPFEDVGVRLQGRRLVMNWPQVEGAQAYTVQLLVVEQGRQREIANVDVTGNSAVIDDLQPVTGQRYVWVISGVTDTQRRFATRGGFVLQ